MKIKLYANYGLLGYEKQVIYSTAKGDIYDEITVELPAGWQTKDLLGGPGLEAPWGELFFVNEAVRSIDGEPWIDVNNDGKIYKRKLRRSEI